MKKDFNVNLECPKSSFTFLNAGGTLITNLIFSHSFPHILPHYFCNISLPTIFWTRNKMPLYISQPSFPQSLPDELTGKLTDLLTV